VLVFYNAYVDFFSQLENDQREVVFNMSLESPGKYVFVVGYMSSLNVKQTLTVNMTPEGGNTTVGKVIIYECEYRLVLLLYYMK